MSDDEIMRLAIEDAKKCPPSQTAYSVGCVITRGNRIVSRGYSREFPDFHAEESALMKLDYNAAGCTIYSTMEPCSTRKSRPKSCTQLIIDSGAAYVVYGCDEPPYFVRDCKGTETLKEHGIEVTKLSDFEDMCLEVNSHITVR